MFYVSEGGHMQTQCNNVHVSGVFIDDLTKEIFLVLWICTWMSWARYGGSSQLAALRNLQLAEDS